jgi:hypothetical protein
MAFSQAVNATLLGTVTDVSGAVVANSKVTITEINTGISRTGETNSSGNYSFPDLPPGQYTVSVEMPGFKKETKTNIDLIVNSSTRVDLQLQPGNVSESIEVTAESATLQTDRTDTGRKMEVQLVEDAPLGNNRNFQSLLNLAPGTAPASFQHSQFFNASSSLQTQVNGQMRPDPAHRSHPDCGHVHQQFRCGIGPRYRRGDQCDPEIRWKRLSRRRLRISAEQQS